jgi:hypothetical protein
VLLVALGVTGCSDVFTPTHNQPETKNQSLAEQDPGDFTLGQGVKTYKNNDGEVQYEALDSYCKTGNIPSDNDPDAIWDNTFDAEVRTFYAYRQSISQEILGLTLDVGIGKKDGLGFNTENTLTESFAGNVLTRKIVMVARVVTGEETFDPVDSGDANYGICQSNSDMTFEEFLEQCGQEYVRKQKRGGVVIFEKNVEGITETELKTLTSGTTLNGPLNSNASVGAVLSSLNSVSSVDAEFDISIQGNLPQPSSQFLSGELTDTEWSNYLSKLQNTQQGSVLKNVLSKYDRSDYAECGADGEQGAGASRAYACFANLAESVRLSSSSYQYVHGVAERVEWKVNNPTKVDWGANPNDNETAYNNWLTKYQNCNAAEPALLDQCRTALGSATNTGNYANVCADCARATQCTAKNLESTYEALSDAYIRVPPSVKFDFEKGDSNYTEPNLHTLGNDQGTLSLRDTDTHVCTLTSVSGGFGGYGEKIRLKDGNELTTNGSWELINDSKRTDPDHYLTAGATCTNISNFYGTDGAPDPMGGVNDKIESTSGSETFSGELVPNSETVHKSTKYVHALGGLKGAMAGGAEEARIDDSADELVVKSNRGAITGYAYSFGLRNPNHDGGTEPNTTFEESVSNGVNKQVTKSLIPVNEGICYLTHVGGELDGGGEVAEVRRRREFWQVRAKGTCKNRWFNSYNCKPNTEYKGIEAKARCYRYNQN